MFRQAQHDRIELAQYLFYIGIIKEAGPVPGLLPEKDCFFI